MVYIPILNITVALVFLVSANTSRGSLYVFMEVNIREMTLDVMLSVLDQMTLTFCHFFVNKILKLLKIFIFSIQRRCLVTPRVSHQWTIYLLPSVITSDITFSKSIMKWKCDITIFQGNKNKEDFWDINRYDNGIQKYTNDTSTLPSTFLDF